MSEQQYRPGDVANGHVLGEDNQWHPLSPPELGTQQMPPEKSGKGWKIALGVVGGIVAISVIGGLAGSPDEEPVAAAPEPTASAEPAAEPEPEPEPTAPGIGDPVRDGKFEFVVTEVQTGLPSVGEDSWDYEEAQGTYTIVTVTVTNIGDGPQTFFDSNQVGIDSQGRELDADTGAGWAVNSDLENWIEDINPGNSITTNVVFDVAPGETIVAVELHDSAFSGGVEVALV